MGSRLRLRTRLLGPNSGQRNAVQGHNRPIRHNPETLLKWRNRATTADAPMGLEPAITVRTHAHEAIIVDLRRRTLLPLDDVMGVLVKLLASNGVFKSPYGEFQDLPGKTKEAVFLKKI